MYVYVVIICTTVCIVSSSPHCIIVSYYAHHHEVITFSSQCSVISFTSLCTYFHVIQITSPTSQNLQYHIIWICTSQYAQYLTNQIIVYTVSHHPHDTQYHLIHITVPHHPQVPVPSSKGACLAWQECFQRSTWLLWWQVRPLEVCLPQVHALCLSHWEPRTPMLHSFTSWLLYLSWSSPCWPISTCQKQ